MCAAALVLPFMNASVKYLTARYPVPEIVWARYAGHLLYCLVLFTPRRGLRLFQTRRPRRISAKSPRPLPSAG